MKLGILLHVDDDLVPLPKHADSFFTPVAEVLAALNFASSLPLSASVAAPSLSAGEPLIFPHAAHLSSLFVKLYVEHCSVDIVVACVFCEDQAKTSITLKRGPVV
jgi:hypothetical protein